MDKRIRLSVEDLTQLNAKQYCELGPGDGPISMGLINQGKDVITVEAPWAQEKNKVWARDNDVKMYFFEFFTGDFDSIEEDVDCFILAHAIAHFRYSPYILLEKIFNKLPSGGFFYLSTVNGSSFDNVLKLFRGQPVTGKVSQHMDSGFDEVVKDFNTTGKRHIWDDWMHVKEYTKAELEEMFSNAGFEIHRSEHRQLFMHWKRNLPIKLWPQLSDELVIVGRKP